MSVIPIPHMTFDPKAVKEVISWFDKEIDSEGFVTDMDGNRIIALDGRTIKSKEIGGIIGVNGEDKIFRNTVPALIEVIDILKERENRMNEHMCVYNWIVFENKPPKFLLKTEGPKCPLEINSDKYLLTVD